MTRSSPDVRVLRRAALATAVAVLTLGCNSGDGNDGDDLLAGAEPIGGGGEIQPTEVATVDPPQPNALVELEDATLEVVEETPEAVPEPAGADHLGGGGDIHPNLAPELNLEGAAVDDLDLHEATAVRVDADGGVWILVLGEPGTGRRPRAHGVPSTALRVQGKQVDGVHTIPPASQAWLLTAGPGSDVEVAIREQASDMTILLGDDPTGADDRTIEGYLANLNSSSPTAYQGSVGPHAITDDGTILVAHRSRSRIDAVAPDGDIRHLLGVRGFDGSSEDFEVPLDSSLGDITSMVALPGERVAFMAKGALHLLEDRKVRTIDITPEDPERELLFIAPGPEGLLLATAAGSETHPQIQVIDVETGEAEVVADLEDVMPHPEGPRGVPGALWDVSAAADGADLVLLADGHLWRMPGVFESPQAPKK